MDKDAILDLLKEENADRLATFLGLRKVGNASAIPCTSSSPTEQTMQAAGGVGSDAPDGTSALVVKPAAPLPQVVSNPPSTMDQHAEVDEAPELAAVQATRPNPFIRQYNVEQATALLQSGIETDVFSTARANGTLWTATRPWIRAADLLKERSVFLRPLAAKALGQKVKHLVEKVDIEKLLRNATRTEAATFRSTLAQFVDLKKNFEQQRLHRATKCGLILRTKEELSMESAEDDIDEAETPPAESRKRKRDVTSESEAHSVHHEISSRKNPHKGLHFARKSASAGKQMQTVRNRSEASCDLESSWLTSMKTDIEHLSSGFVRQIASYRIQENKHKKEAQELMRQQEILHIRAGRHAS